MRPFSIRFPADQLRTARRAARREGISLAQFIREGTQLRVLHGDLGELLDRLDTHDEQIREMEQRLSDLEAGGSSEGARRRR